MNPKVSVTDDQSSSVEWLIMENKVLFTSDYRMYSWDINQDRGWIWNKVKFKLMTSDVQYLPNLFLACTFTQYCILCLQYVK